MITNLTSIQAENEVKRLANLGTPAKGRVSNPDGTITVYEQADSWTAPVPSVAEILANAEAIAHENAIIARQKAVDAITVTVSTGKVFDGDEKSQERLNRAVTISTISGTTTTLWTLADNSRVTVTIAEIKEALVLAGNAQSAIWAI